MAAKHPFGAIKFNSVVYLGAGNGESLNELLAQVKADHWHLVEGDSKKYKRLQQATGTLESNDKIKLHNCVVSDDGTQKTWFSYNLGEFSGLKKAKDLAELFPGIKLKHQTAVDTEALPNFLEQLELTSKENNLLIIDLPGQVLELIEAILKAGQKPLFSQLVLTATKEQLFEQGGNLERIKQWLDKQGYHTRNEPYDDPDFPVLYYSFDKHSAAEFTNLKKELKQLAQERDDAVARVASVEQEHDELVARASGTRQEIEQLKQNLNKLNDYRQSANSQIEELKNKIDTLVNEQQQLKEQKEAALNKVHKLEQELKKVTSERDQQQHYHKAHKERADKLGDDLQQSKIDNEVLEKTNIDLKKSYSDSQIQLLKSIDELKLYQEKIANKLSNEIVSCTANTTKQIESFIGIQQFLQTGDSPLNFHGWPISSDIAVYLLGKLKQEKFDYIIEFGSGTSTVMFAKAITKYYQLQANCHSGSFSHKPGRNENEVCELRKRVIAFEHNKKYLKQTLSELKAGGVEAWADVVHTPLVEYIHNGNDYLHYDCENKLAELATLLEGRRGKILVLVDGPPGVTCRHARFPALPKLLDLLGRHELHIILDDYNRKEEVEVGEEWLVLLEKLGVATDQIIINFEKKALELVLNRV